MRQLACRVRHKGKCGMERKGSTGWKWWRKLLAKRAVCVLPDQSMGSSSPGGWWQTSTTGTAVCQLLSAGTLHNIKSARGSFTLHCCKSQANIKNDRRVREEWKNYYNIYFFYIKPFPFFYFAPFLTLFWDLSSWTCIVAVDAHGSASPRRSAQRSLLVAPRGKPKAHPLLSEPLLLLSGCNSTSPFLGNS